VVLVGARGAGPTAIRLFGPCPRVQADAEPGSARAAPSSPPHLGSGIRQVVLDGRVRQAQAVRIQVGTTHECATGPEHEGGHDVSRTSATVAQRFRRRCRRVFARSGPPIRGRMSPGRGRRRGVPTTGARWTGRGGGPRSPARWVRVRGPPGRALATSARREPVPRVRPRYHRQQAEEEPEAIASNIAYHMMRW